MKIEKKVWQKYFQEILNGNKTFELRLADFECKPGDILILKEWNPETKKFTGQVIEKTVTYVLKTKDINFFTKEEIKKHGFQIMALK